MERQATLRGGGGGGSGSGRSAAAAAADGGRAPACLLYVQQLLQRLKEAGALCQGAGALRTAGTDEAGGGWVQVWRELQAQVQAL